MTTTRFPIIIDREESGSFNAFAPGLPVYASGDSLKEASTALRNMLRLYFQEHPDAAPAPVVVQIATVTRRLRQPIEVTYGGLGSLLGAIRSPRKARASRANGKLGGRPKGRSRVASK